MSFKDEFMKLPPGPAREELVYQATIKQGPPKNLVPVTVDGPGGTKITYKTMADYLTVDGFRVTVTPVTAQRIANHFGMVIPTPKMSKQIYDAAKTKVRAAPLSGTGYTSPLDGKHYSAKDVVKNRISQSDAAVYYSSLTDQELAKHKNPGLISGHGKEITEPGANASTDDVSFGGWQGASGDPLQPYTYAHKGQAAAHTEYALNARFVDDDIIVTLPNGKKIPSTMKKLRENPNLAGAIADSTQMRQYGKDKKPVPDHQAPVQMAAIKQPPSPQPYAPQKPQSGRVALLQRIDSLLDQFGKEA
jgi:hypothetical protein